jgi:membrane protease YdiL (CAAX protease family)
MEGSQILGLLLMWLPGLSAFLTIAITKTKIKIIGWGLGKLKYILIGYFLPIFYIGIVYLICVKLNLIVFVPNNINSQIILFLLIGPFINLIAALGEEIGWRGYLLPNFYKKFGFTKSSIIIGFVWAIWHYPLILFTDFYSGNYLFFSIVHFTVYIVCITFVYNWLWIKSGSIWTVSLLHAVNNFYALNINKVFEHVSDKSELVISDYGIGMPLISLILAIFFWKMRDKLPVREKFQL